jgi:hypothetical protein
MAKYEILYCCATEKANGDIENLKHYLYRNRWVELHKFETQGGVTSFHFVRPHESISYCIGPYPRHRNWIHLSIASLAGKNTIDDLISNNEFLSTKNGAHHEKQTLSIRR